MIEQTAVSSRRTQSSAPRGGNHGLAAFFTAIDDRGELALRLAGIATVTQPRNADQLKVALQVAIGELDELINDRLNAIIHHARFRALEASWRGLWYLVRVSHDTNNIKVKVLDAAWREVARDITNALEFDQSQLFRKIYSDEYGTAGGEPYGVILGDYPISHRSGEQGINDPVILGGLAQIARAAFAPFIAAASPALFGLDSFAKLGQPLDLEAIFSHPRYRQWQSLRARPEAQFVGLVLPRILMRPPYRGKNGRRNALFFRERCRDTETDYCWGSAIYAFGALLIREFAEVGWFGHIRGVVRNSANDSGGVVSDLVADHFVTDSGETARKPLTDVLITDNRERELAAQGLIALCQCYDQPRAAFYSNPSLFKFDLLGSREQKSNAKISAMLQHVLCGSRIAHYIKVKIRDKIGSFASADDCERYLLDWLNQYTIGNDLEWKEQARYPLREARVEVSNHPDKSGQYICQVYLRPQYQLDNLVSGLELQTELAHSA